jgi:hypothetical protein
MDDSKGIIEFVCLFTKLILTGYEKSYAHPVYKRASFQLEEGKENTTRRYARI